MTDPDRTLRAAVADLAGLIERLGGGIGMSEEPSGFAAALEAGAEPEADRRE